MLFGSASACASASAVISGGSNGRTSFRLHERIGKTMYVPAIASQYASVFGTASKSNCINPVCPPARTCAHDASTCMSSSLTPITSTVVPFGISARIRPLRFGRSRRLTIPRPPGFATSIGKMPQGTSAASSEKRTFLLP